MSTIVVNSDSKRELRLIMSLVKQLKLDVCPLTLEEEDDVEDVLWLREIDEACNDELADTDEVLRELGLQA